MRSGDRLRALIEPAVESQGYELVQLEWAKQDKVNILRLYVDHLPGKNAAKKDPRSPRVKGASAVTLEDCVFVSRHVGALLDVEDPISGDYTLEVSSPGVDRPLVKASHFEQFIGERVNVQTHGHHLGRRRFLGILQGFENELVLIEVDGEVYELPFDDIAQATLKPEL